MNSKSRVRDWQKLKKFCRRLQKKFYCFQANHFNMDFLSITKQNISLRCIQNPWLELYPFNSEDSKRFMNKSDQGSRDGLSAPPSGIRLRPRPVVLVARPLNQIETLFETVVLLPLSYFLNMIAPMIHIIWTIFHMLTYIKQVFALVHF